MPSFFKYMALAFAVAFVIKTVVVIYFGTRGKIKDDGDDDDPVSGWR